MKAERKGPVFIIAASICWSFGGLCIKFIPWGAMSIIGMRALLAALVFAVYRRSFKVKMTKGNIVSALCLASTTMLFVFANKLTTAASAILLQFSAPIFIILIEFILYKKKPRPAEGIAVTATILGMLLFFTGQLESGGMLGNVLAIASGLSFAGVFVCNKREDVVPEESLLLGFYINALIGTPFVFFQATAESSAWISILFLGIVQVGLAYVFFSKGIKVTSALLACLITALEPVLNPLWVALATSEIPDAFAVAGGCVIVASVVTYTIWADRHPLMLNAEANMSAGMK